MVAELKSNTMLMLSLGFLIVFANTAPAEEHEIHRDAQIREAKAAIQELEAALEQNPDSERADNWRASLQEHRKKLERLMGETRRTDRDRRRGPAGQLLVGWVISGTEEDVTVRTLETGKVMVLRIPRPRQHDGAWVGRTDLAQLARRTANLEKEQLILARYHGGEGSEAYWLRQVKVISLTEGESDEKPDLLRRVQSLEHRLARIEDMLERRLRGRERSGETEKPGIRGSEQQHRAEDEAQERETHSEDGRR